MSTCKPSRYTKQNLRLIAITTPKDFKIGPFSTEIGGGSNITRTLKHPVFLRLLIETTQFSDCLWDHYQDINRKSSKYLGPDKKVHLGKFCQGRRFLVWISGVIIPFFAGIGIGIGITNHLDSKSGFGSSSGTITPL